MMRRRVMKYAHRIYWNSEKNWSESVKKGWQLYFLSRLIRQGPIKFYYKKKDGSYRCALGKYKNIIPKIQRQESFKTFTYYDLDRRSFRSFRVENFVWFNKFQNDKII